jgi:hypothetical protein
MSTAASVINQLRVMVELPTPPGMRSSTEVAQPSDAQDFRFRPSWGICCATFCATLAFSTSPLGWLRLEPQKLDFAVYLHGFDALLKQRSEIRENGLN